MGGQPEMRLFGLERCRLILYTGADKERRNRYETAQILGMGYGLLFSDDYVYRLPEEIETGMHIEPVQTMRKELSPGGSFLMVVVE